MENVKFWKNFRIYLQQESIPAGCVPPVAIWVRMTLSAK